MQARLTFSIVQEAHEGPVGDDWCYRVEAKVYNGGKTGEATIEVAEHQLGDGVSQTPPGPPEAVTMSAGEAGKPVLIKIRAEATEVDAFRNDVGFSSKDITLQCPADGEETLVHEEDINIAVVETPALTQSTSVLTLTLRFELSCG